MLEFLKERKLVIGLIISLIVSFVMSFMYFREVNASEAYICPKVQSEEDLTFDFEKELQDVDVTNNLTVDIKGAVINPGVYTVSKGSIINDVITLAGGLREDANTYNLNLSKKVTNEMVITVYTNEEVKKLSLNESIKESDSATKSKSKASTNSKVSLNNATLEELVSLPGLGEAKAKLIISYRENCGPFVSKEELKNIKGIGESVYAKLSSYITL